MQQRQRKNESRTEHYRGDRCPACDYSLDMSGLPDDLAAIQDFLSPAVKGTEGYLPDETFLDLKRLYWDVESNYYHAFIGIRIEHRLPTEGRNRGGAEERYTAALGLRGRFQIFEPAAPQSANDEHYFGGTWERRVFLWSSDRRRMRIAGRSWLGPPVRLAKRLTQRHSAVRFEMKGVNFDLFERHLTEEEIADMEAFDAELDAIAG